MHHPEVRPKPAGGPAPEHEGPAVEPDSHWEEVVGLTDCRDRLVYIQVEAVLRAPRQQAFVIQAKV